MRKTEVCITTYNYQVMKKSQVFLNIVLKNLFKNYNSQHLNKLITKGKMGVSIFDESSCMYRKLYYNSQ